MHMYIYILRRCDSSIGIGKATWHHEFNNDEIGFCLLFSSRNHLSWADCISMAIKYAILYSHIILLVLPDTFYLDESGLFWGWIRIRSKSVWIRNTGWVTAQLDFSHGKPSAFEFAGVLLFKYFKHVSQIAKKCDLIASMILCLKSIVLPTS